MTEKKTIFISWSGPLANAVAKVFREWLPEMFDDVDPWMSSDSIQAGSRWLYDITEKLQKSAFGIVVTTLENKNAPWLNYEAGAISGVLTGDAYSRVTPVTVDFDDKSELPTTLNQYQTVSLDEPGLQKLFLSIATALQKDPGVTTSRFRSTWPRFEQMLSTAKSVRHSSPHRPQNEKIDEILNLVRTLSDDAREDSLTDQRTSLVSGAVLRYCEYHQVPYVGILNLTKPGDRYRHVFVLRNDHGLTTEVAEILRNDLGAIADSDVTFVVEGTPEFAALDHTQYFPRDKFEADVRARLQKRALSGPSNS
ncbi:TIR domain-containing protein [Rhodococcus aetherivorans]|uniref:TIR domain-containing protein n=1 Tax=Rhodococcus aetherivorans TaxID=191292 RepID=UPI00388FE3C4